MASTLFQPHLRRSEPDSKVYEGLQSLRPSGRSDIANDRACIWLGSRSSTSTAPRIRPPSTNHNRFTRLNKFRDRHSGLQSVHSTGMSDRLPWQNHENQEDAAPPDAADR